MNHEMELHDSNTKVSYFNASPLMFKNLFRNRNLLGNLVLRDFKNTYHGHFLGYIWSLLEPLVFTGIFYVVLVLLRGDPDELVPLKIMLGILMYNAFSRTLASSTVSFSRNSALIQQIYFPREIIIAAIAGFQGLRLLLSMFIVIPYMIYASISPTPYVLLLPIAATCALLLSKGLGMIFAILHVRFRDLEQIVQLALRAGFYLSGVFFSADIIPEKHLNLYFSNPVAVFIEMFRAGILGDIGVLEMFHIRNAVFVSIAIYLFGMIFFKRHERKAVLYL